MTTDKFKEWVEERKTPKGVTNIKDLASWIFDFDKKFIQEKDKRKTRGALKRLEEIYQTDLDTRNQEVKNRIRGANTLKEVGNISVDGYEDETRRVWDNRWDLLIEQVDTLPELRSIDLSKIPKERRRSIIAIKSSLEKAWVRYEDEISRLDKLSPEERMDIPRYRLRVGEFTNIEIEQVERGEVPSKRSIGEFKI